MEPFDTFESDWSSDNEVATACADIFRYLTSKPLSHYSFSQFKKATATIDDSKVAFALKYLSSPKWRILKEVFLFIDENDEEHEFTAEEVLEYLSLQQFPHPLYGTPIRDLNEILIAFERGEYFDGEAN